MILAATAEPRNQHMIQHLPKIHTLKGARKLAKFYEFIFAQVPFHEPACQ